MYYNIHNNYSSYIASYSLYCGFCETMGTQNAIIAVSFSVKGIEDL